MYTLIVTTSSGTTQKEWKHEKHAFASFNGICMAMVRNNESGIVQMLKGGEVVMETNVNIIRYFERIREMKKTTLKHIGVGIAIEPHNKKEGAFPKLLRFSPTYEKGVYEAKTDSGESFFMIEED